LPLILEEQMNAIVSEDTRLTRIGAKQHQQLKIRAAFDKQLMITLLNGLVDSLGVKTLESRHEKRHEN
jgi:hypothetical protein